MKHYGDITKIKGADVPAADIVCGGSPCQDLSVAGRREGLAGQRSGLFMEQIRIIKEMRDECVRQLQLRGTAYDRGDIRPRFMVWENVYGAFSSGKPKGEDFRIVLEETAKVAKGDACIPGFENGRWPTAGCIMGDGFSLAWRGHDAQYWGVPQRRKRIALVADFGGSSAAEILFERKGLSGDLEESGKQGEGVTGAAEGSADEAGRAYTLKIRGGREIDSHGRKAGKGALVQTEKSGTLGVSQDQTLIQVVGVDGYNQAVTGDVAKSLNNKATDSDHVPLVFEPGAASRVGGHVYEDDVAGTVRANAGDNQQAVVYGISAYDSNSMKSDNPNSGIYEAETTRTLDNNGGNPACNQGGMVVLEGNGSRPSHQGDGYKESEVMYTLNSTEQHAVAYRKTGHAKSAEDGQGWQETEINDTLNSFDSGETRTPTLLLENHPADSRVKVSDDGVVQTLSSRMGTGGGNVPMVMESQGVDVYNGKITGDKTPPLTCNSNATSTQPILLESNQDHATIQTDGISTALPASMGQGGGYTPMVVQRRFSQVSVKEDGISFTLEAGAGEGGNNVPMVVDTYQETTGPLCASGYDKLGTQEAANDMYVVESQNWDGSQIAPTLTANNAGGNQRMPDKDNFNAVVQSMEVFHCTSEEEKVQTLKARDYKDPQIVTYGLDRAAYNQGMNAQYNFQVDEEKIGTQTSQGPGAVLACASVDCLNGRETGVNGTLAANARKSLNSGNVCRIESIVRRLTPLECTRLQGFPDGWVDIGEWTDSKGKLHKDSDGPKYKALGNSIALPFWEWMAKRMRNQYPEEAEVSMASLFSGIGGFELVYTWAGVKPVWASEIEEFPIAVTKIRFPDAE